MGTLADTAIAALDAPANVRAQILRMTDLVNNMNREHRSPVGISRETGQAIIDGIADMRKSVLAVQDRYLDNPTRS